MRRRTYTDEAENVTPGTDRNIDKFDDAKRGLAKLMARENITVQIIDGMPTAKFDVVDRVLTLPNWPFINVDQLDLLIGHEVSHALNTDHTFIERLSQKKGGKKRLMSYINVVEDARIEKKIRESYPGMNSVFYNGYEAFAKNGPIFKRIDAHHVEFDGESHDIRKMNLIDRINLHYKVGAFYDVPFKNAELPWLAKIDGCYSTENACDIAEQLYQLAKETEQAEQQQSKQKSKPQAGKGMSADDIDIEETDDEGDEESEGNGKKKKSDKKSDKPSKGKGGKKGDDKEDDSKDDTDGKSADHDKDGEGDDAEGDDNEADGKESDAEGDDSEGSDGSDSLDDDDADADDSDDADEDSKAKVASNQQRKGDPNRKPEAEPEGSTTDDAVTKALQKLVEQQQSNPATKIKHLLLKPLPPAEVKKRTISATDWMERSEQTMSRTVAAADATRGIDALQDAWNRKFLGTARHMASEFQRKKQAKRMQKARIARTGRLDVNRLSQYKFADDLFKRAMVIPNGQSHGIVLMIDGSSSMSGVFGSVLDQVMLFAHFAFRCNIPFEAYMFSDNTVGRDPALSCDSLGSQTIVPPANGRLVGLVNTVTDRATFKRQIRMLLAARAGYMTDMKSGGVTLPGRNLPYMSLGGTPLYAGMMVMERHVERMKRVLKLDKVMAVVISDGGDTNGLSFQSMDVNAQGKVFNSMQPVGGTAFVVRDAVTKKNHAFIQKNDYSGQYSATPNAVLTLLFDVMADRHDCRSTMLFLVSGYGKETAENIMRRAGETQKISGADMNKGFTDNDQFIVPNGAADLCIVMESDALLLKDDDFSKVNATGNITKAFIDSQKTAQKSRVFVNNVVPYLA